MKTKAEQLPKDNWESLVRDTEALLKRWKVAASGAVGESLEHGQTMVNHLFAANVAFSKITEMLAEQSFLPEGMKETEFF